MERRRSERKDVHISVKLTAGDKSYDGFIENVSHEGVSLNIILAREERLDSFVPGKILELKFKTETRDEITLQCEIKRQFYTKLNFIYIISVEIIDPPAEFKKFVGTL